MSVVVHLCTDPEDDEIAAQLAKHLKPLRVQITHAAQIDTGVDERTARQAQVDAAAVVLLLISVDFLGSAACDADARRALERQAEGQAIVVPVLCRRCHWTDEPFARLPHLPRNGRPISEWSDQDAALHEVAEAIRDHLHGRSAGVSADLPSVHEPSMPPKVADWRVQELVPYLRQIADNSQNWPSWRDIEAGDVWMDDALLERATASLRSGGLVCITGPSGSGKTALARLLVHRLSKDVTFAAHWDFDEFHGSPAPRPDEYLSLIRAQAPDGGAAPLLVLENAHQDSGFTAALLGLHNQPGLHVNLVITSRSIEILEAQRPSARLKSMKSSVIDLTDGLGHRGQAIVFWWLRRRGLSDQKLHRVWDSAPWEDLSKDLWTLRLALQAYDWDRFNLPAWAVLDRLADGLARVIESRAGADDLLYLAAGLGRHGISTDLGAAARVLEEPLEEVRSLADACARAGLLSLDERVLACRYWHQSLARLYWQVFQLHNERWALRARERLLKEEA